MRPSRTMASLWNSKGSRYEIEIAGERFRAEASLKPMYDPRSERVQM